MIDHRASLSKQDFSNRVIAFIGKAKAAHYNTLSGSKRFESVIADVERFAKRNEPDGISLMIACTTSSIHWVYVGNRLNPEPEMKLNAMKTRALVGLLYDLEYKYKHTTGSAIAMYLNSTYTREPQTRRKNDALSKGLRAGRRFKKMNPEIGYDAFSKVSAMYSGRFKTDAKKADFASGWNDAF